MLTSSTDQRSSLRGDFDFSNSISVDDAMHFLQTCFFSKLFYKNPLNNLDCQNYKELIQRIFSEGQVELIEKLIEASEMPRIQSYLNLSNESLSLQLEKLAKEGIKGLNNSLEKKDMPLKTFCTIAGIAYLAQCMFTSTEESHFLRGTRMFAMSTTLYLTKELFNYTCQIPQRIFSFANFSIPSSEQPILFGRNDVINRIIKCWIKHSLNGERYPLIIGDPGVGKTCLLTEIAHRITLGEVPQESYGLLKNKHLIAGRIGDDFNKIYSIINNLKNQIILGIEDLNLLFEQNSSNTEMVLKKILYEREFPLMLFTISKQGYEESVVCNSTYKDLFKPIYLEEIKENDNLSLLRSISNCHFIGTSFTDKDISEIYRKTQAIKKDLPSFKQPALSIAVLSSILTYLENYLANLPEINELKLIESEISKNRMKSINDSKKINKYISILNDLKIKEGEIKSKINKKKLYWDKYCETQKQIQLAKEKIFSFANEIYKAPFSHEKGQKLKAYLIYRYFILPYLEERNKQLQIEHQLPFITEEIIDRAVMEFKNPYMIS